MRKREREDNWTYLTKKSRKARGTCIGPGGGYTRRKPPEGFLRLGSLETEVSAGSKMMAGACLPLLKGQSGARAGCV